MIKSIIRVLLIILFTCETYEVHSGQMLNEGCQCDHFEKLDIQEMRDRLIGKWQYDYSYVDDTCFYIDDLIELSSSYSFEKADLSEIQSKYPRLYSFGEDQLLFGLVSRHGSKSQGTRTYPIVNVISSDSSWVKLTHYVEGNGVGKGYSYYLKSVGNEHLVMKNSISYRVRQQETWGIKHVYKRQTKVKDAMR